MAEFTDTITKITEVIMIWKIGPDSDVYKI